MAKPRIPAATLFNHKASCVGIHTPDKCTSWYGLGKRTLKELGRLYRAFSGSGGSEVQRKSIPEESIAQSLAYLYKTAL